MGSSEEGRKVKVVNSTCLLPHTCSRHPFPPLAISSKYRFTIRIKLHSLNTGFLVLDDVLITYIYIMHIRLITT